MLGVPAPRLALRWQDADMRQLQLRRHGLPRLHQQPASDVVAHRHGLADPEEGQAGGPAECDGCGARLETAQHPEQLERGNGNGNGIAKAQGEHAAAVSDEEDGG